MEKSAIICVWHIPSLYNQMYIHLNIHLNVQTRNLPLYSYGRFQDVQQPAARQNFFRTVLENVKCPGICQYNLKKVSETAAGHTYIIYIQYILGVQISSVRFFVFKNAFISKQNE